MAGLTNYSKWDNLDSDSDSDSESTPTIINTTTKAPAEPAPFGEAEQAKELENVDTRHLDRPAETLQAAASTPIPSNPDPLKSTARGSEKGRYKFMHGGQCIYEWEQDLDCVTIYIKPPEGLPSK